MTICIMIHETAKTKLPRPFNRASSLSELREILSRFVPEDCIDTTNIDTDEPVGDNQACSPTLFYAFSERL